MREEISKSIRLKVLEDIAKNIVEDKECKKKRVTRDRFNALLFMAFRRLGFPESVEHSSYITKCLHTDFNGAKTFPKDKLLDQLEFELNHYHL